jgi:hypothetical protein
MPVPAVPVRPTPISIYSIVFYVVFDTDVKETDKAMGSFCLFSFLVFGAWTGLLYTYKDDVISKTTGSAGSSSAGYSVTSTVYEDDEPTAAPSKTGKSSPGKERNKKMSTQGANAVSMEAGDVEDIDLEEDSEAF